MAKLLVFESVSLDGFFCDAEGGFQWAHGRDDEEFRAWTASNARGESRLLFGRKTYDVMASFWPTRQAQQQLPQVAKAMNASPKTVFSRRMKEAAWENTTVERDLVAAVKRLKKQRTPLVVLGSGEIVSQLSAAGLVDAYQLVVVPVVLGRGRTLFEGVKEPFELELTASRSFENGNVVLSYERA